MKVEAFRIGAAEVVRRVLVDYARVRGRAKRGGLLARVTLSWTNPRGGGAITATVYQLTEPILAPIRRILPPTSGIDWSPLIAMLVLGAISRVVFAL